MKVDWSDEKSIRVWIRYMIRALGGVADMTAEIIRVMERVMPQPEGPEPEEELRDRGLRMCVHCGKTDAEVRLPAPFGPIAGPAVSICEDCTRLACGALGIALADEGTSPTRPVGRE